MPSIALESSSRQILQLFVSGTVAGLSDSQLVERFATRRDKAAFAALVSRHGPMVFSVCRSVLRDEHAAEDAAQATFLVLARKARSLHVGESLGGWLHRVSVRIALEASRRSARIRLAAQAGATLKSANRVEPNSDLVSAIHEEIDRLPEKYCVPVVLCDLQSLTRDEAAARLDCPPGTVAGRLARARTMLRNRLERRGVVTTCVAIGAALTANSVRAASSLKWSETAMQSVTSSARVLAETICRSMFRAHLLKTVATMMVGIAALGGILGLRSFANAESRQEPPKAAVIAAQEPAKPKPKSGISGVALDADGKPAKDVRIFYSIREAGSGHWGRVLAEMTTDDAGHFVFLGPLDGDKKGSSKFGGQGVIWAYRPGSLVASVVVSEPTFPAGSEARLRIEPAARTIIDIRSPEGQPIVGAHIKPRLLYRDYISAPDGLAELIEAETITDATGRAVMTAFDPEEVGTVFVTAKEYGSQQFSLGRLGDPIGPKTITLLPVGRVKGKLVGPLDAVKGRQLTVGTNSTLHPSPYPGLFYVDVDAEGRFEVPEIAVGNLRINLDDDINSPWDGRLEVTEKMTIEAAKTTQVKITLKPIQPVMGIVREKGTTAPIEGVRVWSSHLSSGDRRAKTDKDGRFRGYLKGYQYNGKADLNIGEIPEGYASLNYGVPDVTVSEKEPVLELPAIELSRAGTIKGVVVDARGEPIAGILISASWKVDEGGNRNGSCKRDVRSDAKGRFVVERVPLYAEATLSASSRGLTTPEPIQAKPDSGSDVRLSLNDAKAKALSGRMLDTNGKPIVGARVRLRQVKRYSPHQPQIEREWAVDLFGSPPLITDAEGRFQTPKLLFNDQEYAAYVSVKGYETAKTTWMPGTGESFPDLTLEPEPMVIKPKK